MALTTKIVAFQTLTLVLLVCLCRAASEEAFPPREDKKMLWMQDGNPNTCNDGTVTPPVVIVPFFKTAVTYMRVTFQQARAQDSDLEFTML
ncbi:hypothetical protein ElyMa_000093000 [Elysia marginata]|uniref:Uncharacterized protein n=1 Tax=Elysia marginata TaxID=1093978 RepID=A0AAV4EK57_9GAST|nr:hypothetical protein ElyMa_000093000 [Elysia marginata]